MGICNPPYKYGDKGAWCDCNLKNVPNAPGCFRPECWDRIKFYYDCKFKCPGRTFVIGICNSNSCYDDNFSLFLNGIDIAGSTGIILDQDFCLGTILIADPNLSTGQVAVGLGPFILAEKDMDLYCKYYPCQSPIPPGVKCSPITFLRFGEGAVKKGENTLFMKNRCPCSKPYNGNAGTWVIRNYLNTNNVLTCPCPIADPGYSGGVGEGEDFTVIFEYNECCPPEATLCPTPTPSGGYPYYTPPPFPPGPPPIPPFMPAILTPAPTPVPCGFAFENTGINTGIWSVGDAKQTMKVSIDFSSYESYIPFEFNITSQDESINYLTIKIDSPSLYTDFFCKPSGINVLKVIVKQISEQNLNEVKYPIKIESIRMLCDDEENYLTKSNFISFNNDFIDTPQNNISILSHCLTYCSGEPAHDNLYLRIYNYLGSSPTPPFTVEGIYPIMINEPNCYNYMGTWANDCSNPNTIDIETIDVTGDGGAIYMSHKTIINGSCVDLTLLSPSGSVGNLCGTGLLATGSGSSRINDISDGTFNWDITTYPGTTPVPTPTISADCRVEFQIGTTGCCIEYLEDELLRAVGDGSIFVYKITQSPAKCCKKFVVKVNNGKIYDAGQFYSKKVKDGDIIIVKAESDCGCKIIPVPAGSYSLGPAPVKYKQPIGYHPAECPSAALKAVKNTITEKIKIFLNKNFFRR